jgi:hypothetical protein
VVRRYIEETEHWASVRDSLTGQVTRKENRRSTLSFLGDDFTNEPDTMWVKAAEWFIQDKQLRLTDECHRECQALLHPGRKGSSILVYSVTESDTFEQRCRVV